MIPAFALAARRVYLTATLSDGSVPVTDLDADPELVARPVTPGRASGLGDRMIRAPIALNPSLDDEAVRVMAGQFLSATATATGWRTPGREAQVPGDLPGPSPRRR